MAIREIKWMPLGEYIEPYNVRCGNPDAMVSGVNINKEFIRSHANLETTDISGYYSVPPRHFACNLMHIGRDERIPIAYNNTDNELVVTSAYSVFRVKADKHKDILDEYAEVLSRPKFRFSREKVDAVLELIVKYGVEVFPKLTGELPIDMDDL